MLDVESKARTEHYIMKINYTHIMGLKEPTSNGFFLCMVILHKFRCENAVNILNIKTQFQFN